MNQWSVEIVERCTVRDVTYNIDDIGRMTASLSLWWMDTIYALNEEITSAYIDTFRNSKV